MIMETSPRPAILPTAKVRRYSCHHYAKNDVSDIRREFVGTNKRIKYVPPSISQQASPVSRVHLMKLVGRIGKCERSKGRHLTDSMFKEPHLSDEKVMTSLLLPGQKADERNTQSALMLKGINSSEIGLGNHKYQYINNKKEQEAKFKLPGSTNYDVINDATPDGDVTRPGVNKGIARTRYAQKHSFVSKIGCIKSSLSVYCQTVTRITLLLAIIINVLGGLNNIRLYERKSTDGNSSNLFLSGLLSATSYSELLFLYILRELSAPNLGINEGFCPCIMIETIWNNNKQLIRRIEILHNTLIREEGGSVYPGYRGYVTYDLSTFAKGTILAGKCLSTYLCLFADFWASSVYYLDIYTVNLELDDNFKALYDFIYLYIYNVYRSWASCNLATCPAYIFIKTYTLVYFSPKVIALIIKSHDEYQSIILIGLTQAERANSENQSIFVHNRSYWRELPPLVTPWTFCIKEGVEPWKSQRWSVTSHVQVRVPLLSLSLSLSLSLLSSCPAMLYCY